MVLFLLALFVTSWFVLPIFFVGEDNANADVKTLSKETSQFKSQLLKTKYRSHFYYDWDDKYLRRNYGEKIASRLFVFNPNTLDSLGFVSLGLKPFMAKNILKYRRMGGKFRKPADFARIYGLSSEQYHRLDPYIKIPSSLNTVESNAYSSALVDLNTSDTLQLMNIKGVYGSLAKRIVNYGKKLGGYISVKQIKEVWGLSEETYQRIQLQLIVTSNVRIRKIPINKSSLDRLRSHPYINFYEAKVLYEYRRNHHRLTSFSELNNIEDESITPQFLEKIRPYLSFE